MTRRNAQRLNYTPRLSPQCDLRTVNARRRSMRRVYVDVLFSIYRNVTSERTQGRAPTVLRSHCGLGLKAARRKIISRWLPIPTYIRTYLIIYEVVSSDSEKRSTQKPLDFLAYYY